MLEWYNHLAIYSLSLANSGAYLKSFTIASAILGFLFGIIYSTYDEDIKDSFGFALLMGVSMSIIATIAGFLLAIFWSLSIFYLVPFIVISYGIFKAKDILKWFGNINFKNNKRKRNIIKDTIQDLKVEELAKQAYETLKKDFPNIKYEDVLKNIKTKV